MTQVIAKINRTKYKTIVVAGCCCRYNHLIPSTEETLICGKKYQKQQHFQKVGKAIFDIISNNMPLNNLNL